MGEEFNIFDGIMLIIAIFIAYRIYQTIGKTTEDDEHRKKNQLEKLKSIKLHAFKKKHTSEAEQPHLVSGLEKIQTEISSFHPEKFKKGAKIVFENILKGFISGDLNSVKNFISPNIYDFFEEIIQKRQANKEHHELAFFRISTIEFLESDIIAKQAQIKVKFISEQTVIIKNNKGDIIEGDLNDIDEVTDIWTFEKNVKTKNNDWVLTKIDFSEKEAS